MAEQMKVAIVGGGLSGLATAIGLGNHGFDVRVFERTEALGEVGAGINISPQATKILQALGLGEQIARIGNVVTGQIMRSLTTGEQIVDTGLRSDSAADRFGAPYYTFHRADLLDVLAGALDPARVALGYRCTGIEEKDDGVTLRFANGASYDADVVIAADGIHSVVRQQLYGKDDAVFTGQMAWRAFLDGSAFPADVLGPYGFCGWMGKGGHLMTYYLRGRKIINITTQSDADAWLEEGWSIKGDPDQMRSFFPNATPDLQRLLDSITTCSKWGLFGRKPTHDWGRGRIQLIGDAAHPMLPNAGQGAAQAFEDAYALVRWLDAMRDNPKDALAGFRNVRIPRAHAVQRQSAVNGRLAHSGEMEKRKSLFKEREQSGETAMGLNWIYDYEPTEEWSRRHEYRLSHETETA